MPKAERSGPTRKGARGPTLLAVWEPVRTYGSRRCQHP